MEHQGDNTKQSETANNDGSFEIFKTKPLMAIDKIKGKKKRADIDAIHNFIAQVDTTNIDKNTIKDFVTQLAAHKLLIKKNTSQGNESYHKTPTEEDLLQPPRHSIKIPTKENFNKAPEVEFGTQTNLIHNNICVKNDVFEAFYVDYLEYKGYVNDIHGTSMVKGIRRNEFNSCLKKCNTRFIPFIGATIKQMETYVKPIRQDDTPGVVISHIGCNDISNKNMSANDIAEGIINIGRYCKEHNVNNVTISSLICRSQKHLQHRVNAVNTMLMNRCKNYGLGYIDNSNIEVGFLAQDGLHLNEIGKSCLANNFINYINRYIL